MTTARLSLWWWLSLWWTAGAAKTAVEADKANRADNFILEFLEKLREGKFSFKGRTSSWLYSNKNE